jgi:hypothetical protein
LEDRNLLAQTGTVGASDVLALSHLADGPSGELWRGGAGAGLSVTYVPGFWSVKGVKSTVLTSMLFCYTGWDRNCLLFTSIAVWRWECLGTGVEMVVVLSSW